MFTSRGYVGSSIFYHLFSTWFILAILNVSLSSSHWRARIVFSRWLDHCLSDRRLQLPRSYVEPIFELRTCYVGHVVLVAVSTGKSYLECVGTVNFLHVSPYLCV